MEVMDRYKVELKPRGKDYRGCCPIHKGGKSSSFAVNPDRNNWYCFADCAEGGGVIRFVMKMERCSAREAAVLLATWFGIDCPKPQKYVGKEFLRRLERIAKIRQVPVLVFARRLLEDGLQREELLQAETYKESTRYLEGVISLIIGAEE